MGPRLTATSFILMIYTATSLPRTYACATCSPPYSGSYPPKTTHPPYFKRPPRSSPPSMNPPVIIPPIIITPPVITPPVVNPPPVYQKPPSGDLTPPSSGIPITNPPSSSSATCSIDHLKLGLCVDVLGGLIHTGLGDPVVNTCCPVLKGLLEIEAAVCLCTTIRLKLLNLNIIIPLTLTALVTCGKTIPPGFVCPPLH
ncbi:36.4 kDa proline-rich protein-like [Magnolia sinica]|uniref:36.4 kDa proline-rich protein-like n=1 Tax=Magnolia sinica TaxID=86752 RepID=UPI00265930A0|nr:36.4 kDa proline-rich protein-like [Magnolia sinica]